MYLARMPRRSRSSSAAASASVAGPSPSSGMPTALTPSRARLRERTAIAFLLDEHGIATREQHAVDEIEGLQRARRDQDLVGRAGNAGVPLDLAPEIAQRTVAERAALEAVGRERRALAREHRGRGRNQPPRPERARRRCCRRRSCTGKARPLGRRRRQSGGQQGREVERPGGHRHASFRQCCRSPRTLQC